MTDAGGKFYEGGIRGGTALQTQWATLQDAAKELGIEVGQALGPAVLVGVKEYIKATNNLSIATRALKKDFSGLASFLPKGIAEQFKNISPEITRVLKAAVFAALPPGIDKLFFMDSVLPEEPPPKPKKVKEDPPKPEAKLRPDPDAQLQSSLAASEKRLNNLVKLRGLEGSVLESMKAQLAVQDSVTEQRRLQAEYDIAAGKARKAGKDPSADQAAVDAQAKLKAATIELNSRQIEFADTQERINRAKQEEIRLTEDRIAKAQRSLGVDQATADVRDRLAEIDKRRFEAEVTGRGAVLEDYFNKREESQIRRDPNAKARIDAAKARLAEQGFVDYGPQLVADAKLAGANFKAALLEGADYFSKTIKGATASLEGSFQYLTPKFQDIVLDSARKDIAAAQKAGIFRGDVTFGAKPEDIIGIAGSARSALAAGQQLMSATEGLNAVMKDLTSPLMGLVNKDWRVIVNVAADGQPTVSGDVLGGVA
jgi:hypothetical protein